MKKKILSIIIKILLFLLLATVLAIIETMFTKMQIVTGIIGFCIGCNLDVIFTWVDKKLGIYIP